MKHLILLLFITIIFHFSAFSQDTLVKKSGEEISVKVLKITPSEVEYKRFDNLDGPLIVVLKSELAAIRYANGTREEFLDTDKPSIGVVTNPDYVPSTVPS